MTTREKLSIFKDKINKANEFNAEFKNLVGIELYDFIYSSEPIKKEFEKRLRYLDNLAEDKSFNALQDNLFNAIQKVLKMTSLKEVEEQQKEWNNALFSRLKNVKGKDKNENFLTLPELYVALQNKNHYYQLGDNSYYSPLDGEISFTKHIVPLKKQYEQVKSFFERVFLYRLTDNKEREEQIKKLLTEYNDYWYRIDELIYTTPIKLHFKNFENFFLACAEFYPKKGYESHYNFFKSFELRQTEKELNEVKKNAIVVIDDLVDFIETQENELLVSSNSLISEAIKNAQVANQLNESFGADKQKFEGIRTVLSNMVRSTTPALQQYQNVMENIERQIEPFRQKLDEQTRVIREISKSIIMPNFEAIAPMLKDVERLARRVNETYNESKTPFIDSHYVSSKIVEIEQRNQIITEIKKLRIKVEELTAPKPAIALPQNQKPKKPFEKLIGGNPMEKALVKAKYGDPFEEIEKLQEKVDSLTAKKSKQKSEKTILFLDKRGKLCNEKGKCYEMGETSKRHKLIRFLAINSDYQPTKLITRSIAYENNQTTSGEIIKIRKNIKRDLNINGKEFLEVKKDSGYRINPKYTIKMKD